MLAVKTKRCPTYLIVRVDRDVVVLDPMSPQPRKRLLILLLEIIIGRGVQHPWQTVSKQNRDMGQAKSLARDVGEGTYFAEMDSDGDSDLLANK